MNRSEIYYIEFSYKDESLFIDNVLSKYDIEIVDRCPTSPGLMRIKNLTEKAVKYLQNDSNIINLEPAYHPSQTCIEYNPIQYFTAEENIFPDVGVIHPDLYSFHAKKDHSCSFSASFTNWDTRDQFENTYNSFCDIRGYDSGSTWGFKTNVINQLPVSWGPWRMKIPKMLLPENDAPLTSSTLGTNLFTTEITIDPEVLITDTTGEVIEEETTTDVLGGPTRHDIPLNEGWNIISSYVNTSGESMWNILTGSLYNTTTGQYVPAATVTSSATTPIRLIKNNEGAIIDFTQDSNYNGIGNWNPGEGYQIRMYSSDYQLRISGSIHSQFSYLIYPGWYIMSFPSSVPLDPEVLFAGQIGNIDLIKDNDGQIFAPPNTTSNTSDALFNDIGNFQPGQGYQIKVINNPITISVTNDTLDTGETILIPGCTNPLANNYNPAATEDDGSCIIYGCTDSTAANYNPSATHDDGTCNLSSGVSSEEPQIIKIPCNNLATSTNIFLISTYINLPALGQATGIDIDIVNIFNEFLYKETDTDVSTATPAGIIQSVVDIYNGEMWIVDDNYSSIGDMEPAKGYTVILNNDRDDSIRYELRIPGNKLQIHHFNLTAGWNQIGCPFDTEQDIPTVFASIADKIAIFKDNLGQNWFPVVDVNNIGNMIPGHGYEVKVTQDVTLTVLI